jgi:DNA-binding protein HU-beta
MNRQELIERIAQDTDQSKAAVDRMLASFIDNVQTAVAKGDKITLVGFGSFERVKTAARTGRNPATGAALKIAASKRPKFTAGAKFKEVVKKSK